MLRARRRRPTRPLLAVAAISLAACGSTAVSAAITADPAATMAATQEPGAAMPRVTPDGHPVCGNVTFRAPPSGDCPPR